MSQNKRQRDESVGNEEETEAQTEPLDLRVKVKKSPAGIPYGLKKNKKTTAYNEEAVASSWKTNPTIPQATVKPSWKPHPFTSEEAVQSGWKKKPYISEEAVNSERKGRKDFSGEKVKSARKREKLDVVEDDGVRYPVDVWFLIADYIDPENVGKFARICKDSLYVTDSAVFWSRLYKRYYKPQVYLTDSKQPNTLQVPCGLRTRVIKALHIMYNPLRMKGEISLRQPKLENRMVLRQWHKINREGTQVTNYLEMRDLTYRRRWFPLDEEELREDISANPAEACIVLKITCPIEVPMPPLTNLEVRALKFVKLENKKFQMMGVFHEVRLLKTNTFFVNVGPIIHITHENWWNPRYPHLVPDSQQAWKKAFEAMLKIW